MAYYEAKIEIIPFFLYESTAFNLIENLKIKQIKDIEEINPN